MKRREERAELTAIWRIVALAAVMILLLGLLARRLWSLQIEESRAFASSQMRQSVRRVLLPAIRGRIFDADGECLADNRPSYCIALFIEDLRRPGAWSNTVNAVDTRLDELSLKLGIPRQIGRKEIESHLYKQLPMPLLAWQDVDETTLARFEELVTPNSGMDVIVQPERVYPQGAMMAHIVGRVGRDKPEPPEGEKIHYDIMGMKGRDGIERSRDETLRGQTGGELITVDVSGYRRGETSRPAVRGSDVTLTISTKLQKVGLAALDGRCGAVVMVNVRNGDVLALCSSPTYDVAAMTPRVPSQLWKKLMDDPARPMLNRAITGLYPPGSTFKPLVALAALRAGTAQGFTANCNGVFELGGMKLRCAARYGHGDGITMRKALEVSCNPFFCELGVKTGLETIAGFAREAGLGKKTGICLPGEASGLVPDDAWKRKVRRDGWRPGDTANLSIGQGYLLATPLQMALATAAIANGGTLWKPRLCADESVKAVRKITLSEAWLSLVRGGMSDVVNAPKGGGRRARVKGVHVAAKTGTAEYGPRSNRRKHAWMVAFAPFEKPEIAVAAVIEDGESGGVTAAPVVASVLASYFGSEPEDSDEVQQIAAVEEAPIVAEASAEPGEVDALKAQEVMPGVEEYGTVEADEPEVVQ